MFVAVPKVQQLAAWRGLAEHEGHPKQLQRCMHMIIMHTGAKHNRGQSEQHANAVHGILSMRRMQGSLGKRTHQKPQQCYQFWLQVSNCGLREVHWSAFDSCTCPSWLLIMAAVDGASTGKQHLLERRVPGLHAAAHAGGRPAPYLACQHPTEVIAAR